MQFVNEVTVEASPDELFEFVSDVERVAGCLPGARITGRDDDTWNGAMRIKVGPILANYQGTLQFLELDSKAHRAAIQARASEVNGQGSAEARIATAIEPTDGGSRITMTTDLQIRGRVAQFGRGAMEKISERMFAEFARNLEQAIKEPAATVAAAAGETDAGPSRDGESRPPPPRPPSTAEAEALDVFDLVGLPAVRRVLPMILVGIIALAFGFLLGERRAFERSAGA